MIDYDCETSGFQAWSGKQYAFLYQFYDGQLAEALRPETDSGRIQWWFDRANVAGIRAWNTNFDRAFADAAGFDLPPDGKWHDGMLIAQIINERRSVALKAVGAELFGDERQDTQKDVKAWLTAERARRKKQSIESGGELIEPNYSDVPADLMVPYALEDVYLTRQVCDQYEPILEQTPELQAVYEFEREVLDAVYAIQKRGLPADESGYRHLEHEVIANLDTLENRIEELADTEDFNPKSSAQIIAALEKRGADMSFMEKDGNVIKSADKENLQAVDDELATAILSFRSEFKVLSTYIRPMLGRHYDTGLRAWYEPFISPNGRVHATYRQSGARTGRMSSNMPNIQNQPRDDLRLRYNIRAEPGHKLVAVDLSNIEMRLFAAYAGEGRLLTAIRDGKDLHQETAKLIGISDRKRTGGAVESARQRGKTFNFCVPKTTEILTKRGWLQFSDVRAGDHTIGYDADLNCNRWTRIDAVIDNGRAPLMKLSSRNTFEVTTTPEHRWSAWKRRDGGSRGRYTEDCMVSSSRISCEHTLRLSAPFADNPNDASSPRDAALIGWLVSDGDAKQMIFQSKPDGVMAIEALLTRVQHSIYAHHQRGVKTFYIKAQDANPLWATVNKFNSPAEWVLSLGRASLVAFMSAVYEAEGITSGDASSFAQNEDNPWFEAMVLGTYLMGDRPTINGKARCKNINLSKPYVTGQRLVKTPVEDGETWCVQTDLGTWTMREGNTICLTGNSTVYGGGLRTIQKQLRVDIAQARLLRKRYYDAYPEVERLQQRIEYRLLDQGYVKDLWGRRYRCFDARKEAYKFTNYLIQGTAAEILKDAVVSLHADGVPVVALVHDEIVAHVPESDAPEVEALIKRRLTQQADPGGRLHGSVPLAAEGGIYDRWSDAKPLKDGSLFAPEWACNLTP